MKCHLTEYKFLELADKAGFNQNKEQLESNLAVLNFLYDFYTTQFNRPPTLREIPNANSLSFLERTLNIKNDSVSLKTVLDYTKSSSLEDAITKLNLEFNDKIIDIIPLKNEGIITIKDKVNCFTPIDISKASNALEEIPFIRSTGQNKVTIDSDLYLQMCSKNQTLLNNPNEVYKNMFLSILNNTDIDTFLQENLSQESRDHIEIEETISPKNSHRMLKLYIPGKQKGWWELLKDNEFGFYSIHMKTAIKMADGSIKGISNILPSTKEERQYLYQAVKEILPPGACISTWGDLTQGGFIGLDKLGQGLTLVGQRLGSDKEGNARSIPIFLKPLNLTLDLKLTKQELYNKYAALHNTATVTENLLLETLLSLSNRHDIKIHQVTFDDIKNNPELNEIPGVSLSKAFVHKGEVYLNTDLQTKDSKIHEILHIFLGSLKVSNPNLYYSMISSAEKFTNFKRISKDYPNRIKDDLLEEVYVENLGRYLAGLPSEFSLLPNNALYEVKFHIFNMIDTLVNGKRSVTSFKENNPFNFTFLDLCVMLESKDIDVNANLNNASLIRLMSNLKENLVKEGKLIEKCN